MFLQLRSLLSFLLISVFLIISAARAGAENIFDAVMKRDVEKVKAIIREKPELVNVKIDKGGEYFTVNSGDTPLIVALNHFNNDEKSRQIIELLIENGADVNLKNDKGETPLISAVNRSSNKKYIIRLLIENGADVNLKDNNGDTPLMFAVYSYKDKEIIELLVENGAHVNDKNNDGETPLIKAMRCDNLCDSEGNIFISPSYNKEVPELLISGGADVNAKTDEGITALMYAARTGNIEIIQFLVKKGAHVREKDKEKRTLLHWALTKSIYDPESYAVNKHGFINIKRYNFDKKAEKKLIEFLLSLGLDINSRDKKGRTPLNCAKENGDKEITELLIKHGGVTYGDSFNELVDRGTELYNKDKYEESIKYFTGALKLDKENSEVWMKKGDAFYNLGKYEKASGCYAEAYICPHTKATGGKIIFNKGKALYQLSKYWDALWCFNGALYFISETDPFYLAAEKEKSKTETVLLSILPVPGTEPVLPEMATIEGGSFMMGSKHGTSDEKPPHRVKVDGFYLGKYEVTNKEFCIFLNSNFSDPSYKNVGTYYYATSDDNFGIMQIGTEWRVKEKYENRPVVGVTWYGAVSYCKWLSEKTGLKYRLPSEAEWEYACRAGTQTDYYGGNKVDYTEERHRIYETGKGKPNPWGLYDMSWNVFEWCSDWYGNYPKEDVYNPQGPSKGSCKVIRGGGLYMGENFCRSFTRDYMSPESGTDLVVYIGFRIARSKTN